MIVVTERLMRATRVEPVPNMVESVLDDLSCEGILVRPTERPRLMPGNSIVCSLDVRRIDTGAKGFSEESRGTEDGRLIWGLRHECLAAEFGSLVTSLPARGRGWNTLTDIGDDDGVVTAVDEVLRELKENQEIERVTVVADEDEDDEASELNS